MGSGGRRPLGQRTLREAGQRAARGDTLGCRTDPKGRLACGQQRQRLAGRGGGLAGLLANGEYGKHSARDARRNDEQADLPGTRPAKPTENRPRGGTRAAWLAKASGGRARLPSAFSAAATCPRSPTTGGGVGRRGVRQTPGRGRNGGTARRAASPERGRRRPRKRTKGQDDSPFRPSFPPFFPKEREEPFRRSSHAGWCGKEGIRTTRNATLTTRQGTSGLPTNSRSRAVPSRSQPTPQKTVGTSEGKRGSLGKHHPPEAERLAERWRNGCREKSRSAQAGECRHHQAAGPATLLPLPPAWPTPRFAHAARRRLASPQSSPPAVATEPTAPTRPQGRSVSAASQALCPRGRQPPPPRFAVGPTTGSLARPTSHYRDNPLRRCRDAGQSAGVRADDQVRLPSVVGVVLQKRLRRPAKPLCRRCSPPGKIGHTGQVFDANGGLVPQCHSRRPATPPVSFGTAS